MSYRDNQDQFLLKQQLSLQSREVEDAKLFLNAIDLAQDHSISSADNSWM